MHEDGLHHRLPADPLVARELPRLEVLRRENPHLVQRVDPARGPILPEVLHLLRDERFRPLPADLVEPLRVVDRRVHVPLHRHGLQVLRAHHRADPAPRVRAVPVVHDRGEPDEVLPGGPDAAHPHVPPVAGADRVFRLADGLPPEGRGVVELRSAVDREVHRVLRPAPEHEAVPPRPLQLGPEEPAAVGLAEEPGQRAVGRDEMAAAAADEEADEGARHVYERVVGAEGVPAPVFFQEDAGRESLPAQVRLDPWVRDLVFPDPVLRQVDVQKSAEHRVHRALDGARSAKRFPIAHSTASGAARRTACRTSSRGLQGFRMQGTVERRA